MDPLAAHQRAQDAFSRVLAGVGPDQLDAPSPCTEWTVSDLIGHVLYGNEHVGIWAGGPDEPPARPENVVAAHRAAATAAHEVFARPDGMSITFRLPFGDFPAEVFVGLRTMDVLTHAWDLAAATGQCTDLDPELATEQLAAARRLVGPQIRGPGQPFGDEQPCPPERAPADQLAAFLGRKV
ncbi:TIGR03086 family metal-binding protein [Mycobacterium spongiae]|uniref:TIGR03086 family protein n=1 Tax=Mycobacterium spongiae TaxID=886343 RepID=A0A975JVJ0_9MYCO|nr:TIGR03086 family metal-binding protein [Mycobacterium spongiae]QUR66456.1 TIGR03086 family protein [Mycobacterium spongiae]